jgi:uncharacterized protein YegP (UPF0339 family)
MPHPIRSFQRQDLRFYVYIGDEGRYQWSLETESNYKVARSAEGFVNRSDCLNAIGLVAGVSDIPILFAPGIAEVNPPF